MNDATGRNTARRRRADTIARCGRIMETARRLPLTRDVLAEAIERATPVQLDLMESRLDAEIASRERSKRVRLLKAAGFPNAKDIEGYDWSNLRMPADWGRVLGDKNMAAALIDRTVHHGRLIRFEGGSYRSEHALMTR